MQKRYTGLFLFLATYLPVDFLNLAILIIGHIQLDEWEEGRGLFSSFTAFLLAKRLLSAFLNSKALEVTITSSSEPTLTDQDQAFLADWQLHQ